MKEDANIKSYPKKAKPISPHEKLRRAVMLYCEANPSVVSWDENELPKKWKLCEDLLILPANCFTAPHWSSSPRFWQVIADCFGVGRVAQENRVNADELRTPNLKLLHGTDPIVTITNNQIKYSYDITKCMFSWGNITEKLRLSKFDCSNEVVVDLFAGIGYFTLVYLVHCKAKRVIACEKNPDSVEALHRNLVLNKCEDRCQILLGDNCETCPKNCANRVNLGLIPSSEISWQTAADALSRDTGGYLHIHSNIDVAKQQSNSSQKPEWLAFAEYARTEIKRMLEAPSEYEPRIPSREWQTTVQHIEYVKSYGPRVDHIVVDLLCKPHSDL